MSIEGDKRVARALIRAIQVRTGILILNEYVEALTPKQLDKLRDLNFYISQLTKDVAKEVSKRRKKT